MTQKKSRISFVGLGLTLIGVILAVYGITNVGTIYTSISLFAILMTFISAYVLAIGITLLIGKLIERRKK